MTCDEKQDSTMYRGYLCLLSIEGKMAAEISKSIAIIKIGAPPVLPAHPLNLADKLLCMLPRVKTRLVLKSNGPSPWCCPSQLSGELHTFR